jgi:2',3'-cyclic-nucleotide 2'-phosphodiesterase
MLRMKLLFIGDVVGSPGRKVLEAALPALREEHSPEWIVVNGENSAGGLGVTPKTARAFFDMGADAITLGNHAYRHRDAYAYLDEEPRSVRPGNYLKSNPGRGYTVVEKNGARLGVANLSGTVFMKAARSPFSEIDSVLEELDGRADHVLVDFHAEATSEKIAMGWHLDGRVTACVGTHTHVPTADARVLPGGTAYVSDVGMTGARDSVIGVRTEQALESFRTQMPVRFDTADESPWVNAVLIEGRPDGLAGSIEQLLVTP